MADFNNTTTKTGLIQKCELYTNLGDATISGDATLLKQFTGLINDGFDNLMPFLLTWGNYLKWDDANNTDLPVGTFNLVSGQADYTIAQDANSLDILSITNVRILPNATATQYMDLDEITMDDPRAAWAMSPATTDVGTPVCYLKRGNTLFFFPKPNYNATNGGKIYFEREESYFSSADTIKTPGFVKPFHILLALYASLEWLLINKPANTTLITRLEGKIAKKEQQFKDAIKARYPIREKITNAPISFR